MNKIYWWTKQTYTQDIEYRDLDLLYQFISEGKFIHLSFDNSYVEFLLYSKTRVWYQVGAADKTLSISGLWKSDDCISYNFSYVPLSIYYISNRRKFKFKEITQEEYSNLISKK